MKEFLKSNTDERPGMIILGILTFYALIAGFIIYLFFLHRISAFATLALCIFLTLAYIPRFLIIRKFYTKDKIEIIDDYIMINGVGINFRDIKDFRADVKKPQIIFFINNKIILFQQAKFHLLLKKEDIEFTVIGSEKINLLKEFLEKILQV